MMVSQRANVKTDSAAPAIWTSPPSGLLQRKCACGGSPGVDGECAECRSKRLRSAPPMVQPKLTINEPGDKYEQEADRVADQVMRMPEPKLQRDADEQEEEEELLHTKPLVQRRVAGDAGGREAPPIVHDVLRSPGHPLDPSTRQFTESRFGHDFSQVRVHTDAKAAASARAVNALAYTVGRDMVFGAGHYAPGTASGQRLLAHELAHTIQQAGTDGHLQRFVTCESPETCPPRDTDEVSRALREDMMVGGVSGPVSGLLVANFAVGGSSVKPDLNSNTTWTDFSRQMVANTNLGWEILGFSDCHGTEGLNRGLREERANALHGALPPPPRSQVDSVSAAPLTACMAENTDEEERALNRSAFIRLKSTEITFTEEEAEEITGSLCGPEVTDWLINQMNVNQNDPVIRTGREHRWPRWVPVFNVGWTIAAFYSFSELVGPGKPWDFKRTQGWWRAGTGRSCPTDDCDRTVTLCGHCVNYDVPGNIHFGWVGRKMEIAPWALHAGAGGVQEGGAAGDDPPDTVAINIGIAMADGGKGLCDEVNAKLNQLNLDRTVGCLACTTS